VREADRQPELPHVRFLTLLLLATLASCGSTGPEPAPDPDLRILFIGNSLTYFNDLPALVRDLGRSDRSRPVTVSAVAFPNYSLVDHWNQGDAVRAINSGPWDYVVLQQGPSALPASREVLVEYAGKFAEAIRSAGAEPAIYMVWPGLDRVSEWNAVTASYTAAAQAVHGVLLPGGEAIRAAYTADRSLPLFEGDGFHPALAGSHAVALTIFARLTGVSPIGLTAKAGGSSVPASQVPELETAAADALQRFPTP
jgi:hypothetical protein